MVYKRYIKKRGKKLGPYYYHSVKEKDGSVKTIYLGRGREALRKAKELRQARQARKSRQSKQSKQPKKSKQSRQFWEGWKFKHATSSGEGGRGGEMAGRRGGEFVDERGELPERFSVPVLLVLAVVLLAIFGTVYFFESEIISFAVVLKSPFEVDQLLIKLLIKEGGSLNKEVRITNSDEGPYSVKVLVEGLDRLVEIGETDKEFLLSPGETRIISLDFHSEIEDEGVFYGPGVYVGKLEITAEFGERFFVKDVPLIVEIESGEVFFDMNLNIPAYAREIEQGDELEVEIRIFNLYADGAKSVDVEYFIKDTQGNTILTERESVVVETQFSFFKVIKIPDSLRIGTYVFAVESEAEGSIGTSSYLFDVVSARKPGFKLDVSSCKENISCLAIVGVFGLALIVFLGYVVFLIIRRAAPYFGQEYRNLGRIREGIVERAEKSVRQRAIRRAARIKKAERERLGEIRARKEEKRRKERLEQRMKERGRKVRLKRQKERAMKVKKFFVKVGLVKTPGQKRLEKERARQKLERRVEKVGKADEKKKSHKLVEKRKILLMKKYLGRVKSYVLKNRRAGFSDSEIRKQLIKDGWPSNVIKRAFSEASK